MSALCAWTHFSAGMDLQLSITLEVPARLAVRRPVQRGRHAHYHVVLLCYKKPRKQQGQRGKDRARWVAMERRRVAMESGRCRSGRSGRSAGVESAGQAG